MQTKSYGTIILASCVWATLAFSQNYETWEKAIKNSDLDYFSQMSRDETINQADLQGLLVLADEVIKQREDDIYNRKCRVYGSIALKILPITGICPIIGYILDQRGLGIELGVSSFIMGAVITLIAAGQFADNNHEVLAASSAVLGLAATTATTIGCAILERWFWQKERCSYEKLEKAHQDAVAVKARLTALAAKNK